MRYRSPTDLYLDIDIAHALDYRLIQSFATSDGLFANYLLIMVSVT